MISIVVVIHGHLSSLVRTLSSTGDNNFDIVSFTTPYSTHRSLSLNFVSFLSHPRSRRFEIGVLDTLRGP